MSGFAEQWQRRMVLWGAGLPLKGISVHRKRSCDSDASLYQDANKPPELMLTNMKTLEVSWLNMPTKYAYTHVEVSWNIAYSDWLVQCLKWYIPTIHMHNTCIWYRMIMFTTWMLLQHPDSTFLSLRIWEPLLTTNGIDKLGQSLKEHIIWDGYEKHSHSL